MAKPILTISNFKPIQDGGSYFLQGFEPKTVGNTSILSPTNRPALYIDSDDTGFSNLGALDDLINTNLDCQSNAFMNMYGISNGYIFHFNRLPDMSGGEMFSINISYKTSEPGLAVTERETLLFTGSKHLGLAYYFTVNVGTATSVTLNDYNGDAVSTLFSTYGIDDNTWNGHIFNLTTGEAYDNTTSEPTDTLNFTTATTTPSAGDEVLIFLSRKFSFIDNFSDRHFIGQRNSSDWNHQIIPFGNDYYILNGNYLAVLESDETTFAREEKALPHSVQGVCGASNSDKILVGGDYKGSGKLLLWDGESSFWNYSLDIPFAPESIVAYGGDFLLMSAGVLYWTNGYEVNKIAELPDNILQSGYCPYNGLKILNDKIYIVNNGTDYNRFRIGLYIYDLKTKGFSFMPFIDKDDSYPTHNGSGGALLFQSDSSQLWCGTSWGFTKIDFNKESSYGANSYYAQFLISLPNKMKISNIELNLALPNNKVDNNPDLQTDVIVSVGDGRKGMYYNMDIGESTTTKIVSTSEVNYDTHAEIGEQIEILQSVGNSSGEKVFITGITDPSTATVDYDIDYTLANAPTSYGVNAMLYKLKKQGSKNIQIQDLDMLQDLTFPVSDFYSDKLWLEVLFRKTSGKTALALNINSIKIF